MLFGGQGPALRGERGGGVHSASLSNLVFYTNCNDCCFRLASLISGIATLETMVGVGIGKLVVAFVV